MPPLTSTFMPLVPHASQGRRGVLSQTIDALHQLLSQKHVVVTEEDHMGRASGRRMKCVHSWIRACPAWSAG